MSKKDKKCQIYLAGPFFNEDQIKRIQTVEKILTENKTVESFFSPRQEDQFLGEQFGSSAWVAEIYRRNQFHIINCDCVLGLIDYEGPHVDSGTAYEIGFAVAHKKPVILFHQNEHPVNIMLCHTAHYYCKKFEDLINYDFVNRPANKYEGKIF